MAEGTVRKTEPGVAEVPDAPFWVQVILGNAAAYGDFYTDMSKGMQRCSELVTEYVTVGNIEKANQMVGKKEALHELRYMVDMYRKQAMEKEE